MKPNDELAAGLKEAMLAEQAGIEFYTTAAEKTADVQGKAVFQQLADEERQHLDYLRRQMGHRLNNTRFEPLTGGSAIDPAKASPIFSRELINRLGTAHWEMTALSVGLVLEQNAIQRYRQLAEKAESVEGKEFFNALVRWEESHAAALQKQLETLREFYWQQARFAPF